MQSKLSQCIRKIQICFDYSFRKIQILRGKKKEGRGFESIKNPDFCLFLNQRIKIFSNYAQTKGLTAAP